MIGIFSHFGGDTLALNVSQDICEKIKFGEDGYYFLPINEDKTPVEPYIHLQHSPQKGLISFFSSYHFEGLGKVGATELIDELGSDLLLILKNRDFTTLSGRGFKKFTDKLLKGWENASEEAGFEILFSQIGFNIFQKNFVRKIGQNVFFEKIHKDPVILLLEFPRINFFKSEDIIKELGIEITDRQKVRGAAYHIIDTSEKKKGNTCLPLIDVLNSIAEMTHLPEESVKKIILEIKDIFEFFEIDSESFIETRSAHSRDKSIIKHIDRLESFFKDVKRKRLRARQSAKQPLSDEQVEAVQNSAYRGVSIITGGPGTGKTRIIEGLVQVLSKEKRSKIRICAPTGRAAKRVAENRALNRFNPSTIHMLLHEVENSSEDLKVDTIIVDEASMIDINLLQRFIEVIPDKAQLILVGDPDQLPPVGPGQPFSDLINSKKVKVSKLTKQFRQGSDSSIPEVAKNVNIGKIMDYSSSFKEADFSFVETPKEKISENILLIADFLGKGKKAEDILEEMQVLSPQKPYNAGIIELNQLLQKKYKQGDRKLFSKKEDDETDVDFYIGDKVICKKNDYKLKVTNGDIGYITNFAGKNIYIKFDDGEKMIPDTNKEIIDLAYAITVHKSQGSEYPYMIMPISEAHQYMLTRKLVYTAITRGKQKVILVGSKNAFEKALQENEKDKRHTDLSRKAKPENA